MSSETQRFYFLSNVEDPSSKVPMSTDLNLLSVDNIKNEFVGILTEHSLALDGRYVAVGSYGDVVIYENGEIDMVSDSG